MRPGLRSVAAAAILCALTGCEHHFFTAHGSIVSDGGGLGTWRTAPLGCTRDPQDGAKPGEPTTTVAEFLWRDTGQSHRALKWYPERPIRLTVSHAPDGGYAGMLELAPRPLSITLDTTICTRLEVQTHESAPQIRGGHPALDGRVQLDCRVQGSHLTADLRFAGCEF